MKGNRSILCALLVIVSSANALFVRDDLIRVAPGIDQSKKKEEKLFWFMIPTKEGQREEALIALNEGQWWPSIDINGSANFVYIDPDVIQQQKKTFLRLPAGLFYWQDNNKGTLRNRPEKPVAERSGGEYGTEKGGRWNGAVYEKFPHPFLPADVVTLTTNATASILSNPVGMRQATSPVTDFSLVFADILMDSDYQEQFKKKNGDITGLLTRAQRQEMIRTGFANPELFKDKDIIAFVDYDDVLKLPENTTTIVIRSTENLMLVNGLKFSVVNTQAFQSGDVNCVGMITVLQTRDTYRTNIGVVVVQLPVFAKGSAGDELRMEQINKMAQAMSDVLKQTQVKCWIIAGNFNIDPLTKQYMEPLASIMTFSDALTFKDRWTSLINTKPAMTDVLMYSGLKLVSTARYPAVSGALLKYSTTDGQATYFSDHAALTARFTVPLGA